MEYTLNKGLKVIYKNYGMTYSTINYSSTLTVK